MKTCKLYLVILCTMVAGAWAHGGEGPDKAALKRLFPTAETFITRTVKLSGEVQKKIAARLGEALEGHDLTSNAYIPTLKGQSLGVIWVTDADLKEGPIDVMVGLDRQGKIVGVELEHSPVAALGQSAYLKQYKTLDSHSAFQQGKDIKALSGNPAASKILAQAVRKGAIFIDEAFLSGK